MSEEPTLEDRVLQAALATLERGGTPPAPAERGDGPPAAAAPAEAQAPQASAAAAEAETLARLYHEALGLLPFALPPAAPPPGLKQRLMEAALPPSRPPIAAPVEPRGSLSPDAAPSEARRSRRWPLALAAALILALLGTCGWLALGLRQQEETIARLARQRDQARQRSGEVEARLARLTAEVRSMGDKVAVVASPGVEACALKPVALGMSAAHGMLFVAADHQHWYMALRGLPPPGANRVYQLWFVADQGPVSGGTFTVEPGKPWELSSEHMPAGTKAVRVTLENGPGAPTPSGPDVLRNADSLHAI